MMKWQAEEKKHNGLTQKVYSNIWFHWDIRRCSLVPENKNGNTLPIE